uniref:Uncharacterized protein n=1 Tax=Opuntia streptacantha TaxID=393608 RepID=A0A7C9CKD5_OPUST
MTNVRKFLFSSLGTTPRLCLKNCLTASSEFESVASVLAGVPLVFPAKLTFAMKPVPNRDFNLIDVPMHRSLPFAMIPIRSLSISASSIECVVRIMARPCLAFSIMSHTCLLLIGSIPVVGSSRIINLGSPIRAIATLSRRFIPPL